MANEIKVSVRVLCTKSGSIGGSVDLVQTQAGDQSIGNVQNIGTAAEALVLGDISTIGWLYVENLDPTNYVEIDSVNTLDNFPQKLLPGEVILLKPQTATIYARANTAACNVFVAAFEL